MENVKIWNQQFAGKTTFGETSRSDFFEEEMYSLGQQIPPSQFGKRASSYNTLPQPKKAVELGHTANNVCQNEQHDGFLFFKSFFFDNMNRFRRSSTGSMFLECSILPRIKAVVAAVGRSLPWVNLRCKPFLKDTNT